MTATHKRTPTPGDVWQLAIDGEALGVMVMVLGARDDYVLAVPVTTTDQPHFPPALLMPGGLVIWPSRETGLSSALLSTFVSRPLTSAQVIALGEYGDSGHPPPLPLASGTYDEAFSVAMVEEMAELCHWEPAAEGGGPMSRGYAMTDRFAPSKRPYAIDRSTFTPNSYRGGRVDAVWAGRKNGRTVITIGQLPLYPWSMSDNPSTLDENLAVANTLHGGDWHAQWDGTNLLVNPRRPLTLPEQVKVAADLDGMLRALPQVPPGFEGWYVKDGGGR